MKFVIIGLGHFGRALARNLAQNGYEVSVLDLHENVINEMKSEVASAQVGDASDRRVLDQLDLVGDDIHVIVAIGEGFERSILITAQLKEIGVKHLYARSVNSLHSNVLKLIGIRDLFRVEDVAAKQLADHFINKGLMRRRRIDKTHMVAEVNLPKDWIGKRLMDVNLRTKFQLNLLTLRRGAAVDEALTEDALELSDQPVIDTATPDLVFLKDDVLVIFGKDSDLECFAKAYKL